MSYLVELAHDEYSDPHEVKHTVDEHPEHPRRAGGDLGDVDPKAVFSVAGSTVNPPVCRNRTQSRSVHQYYANNAKNIS